MLVLKIFLKEAGALDTEKNIIRVFNRQKDLCSYKIVLRLFKKTNQKKQDLKNSDLLVSSRFMVTLHLKPRASSQLRFKKTAWRTKTVPGSSAQWFEHYGKSN